MGGFADDLFNIFYRMKAREIVAAGFEAESQGRKEFQEKYGVLETVEKVRVTDNACSKAQKRTIQVRKKPGASPLLFGKYLMESTAFVTLEDISDQLPPYDEAVIQVDLGEGELAGAYEELTKGITKALEAHKGNRSLVSIMLNKFLLYPDHPFGLDEIWGTERDSHTGNTERFFVTNYVIFPRLCSFSRSVNW